MIVVDTSVWVQALRTRDSPERQEMDRLLAREEIAMVGPVLTEVLGGARSDQEFEALRPRLMALPHFPETRLTWLRVGEVSFQLRRVGSLVPLIDIVIAALAIEHDCSVYTLDQHFQRIPGVAMHQVGG
jgi:predicted nucleic acid-binding protein